MTLIRSQGARRCLADRSRSITPPMASLATSGICQGPAHLTAMNSAGNAAHAKMEGKESRRDRLVTPWRGPALSALLLSLVVVTAPGKPATAQIDVIEFEEMKDQVRAVATWWPFAAKCSQELGGAPSYKDVMLHRAKRAGASDAQIVELSTVFNETAENQGKQALDTRSKSALSSLEIAGRTCQREGDAEGLCDPCLKRDGQPIGGNFNFAAGTNEALQCEICRDLDGSIKRVNDQVKLLASKPKSIGKKKGQQKGKGQ